MVGPTTSWLDGMTGSTNDYLFHDINPAFEKMTGLSREYIIGKKVTEIYENRKDEVFDWIGLYDRIPCIPVKELNLQIIQLC